MAITLYMDHNVERAITMGIRIRGVDVLMAYEDGASQMADAELLKRAGSLGRVLVTRDDDLLVEATQCQRAGTYFSGVIYAHLQHVDVGTCIHDLELIARAGQPEDFTNRVQFLPL